MPTTETGSFTSIAVRAESVPPASFTAAKRSTANAVCVMVPSEPVNVRNTAPAGTASPTVTFVERVTVSPGGYELTAVMSGGDLSGPHAHRVALDIPAIPRDVLFLTDPVLGRAAGSDVVILNEAAPRRSARRRAELVVSRG